MDHFHEIHPDRKQKSGQRGNQKRLQAQQLKKLKT